MTKTFKLEEVKFEKTRYYERHAGAAWRAIFTTTEPFMDDIHAAGTTFESRSPRRTGSMYLEQTELGWRGKWWQRPTGEGMDAPGVSGYYTGGCYKTRAEAVVAAIPALAKDWSAYQEARAAQEREANADLHRCVAYKEQADAVFAPCDGADFWNFDHVDYLRDTIEDEIINNDGRLPSSDTLRDVLILSGIRVYRI